MSDDPKGKLVAEWKKKQKNKWLWIIKIRWLKYQKRQNITTIQIQVQTQVPSSLQIKLLPWGSLWAFSVLTGKRKCNMKLLTATGLSLFFSLLQINYFLWDFWLMGTLPLRSEQWSHREFFSPTDLTLGSIHQIARAKSAEVLILLDIINQCPLSLPINITPKLSKSSC